ncbi:nucleotidyl transferase AbiEii/AbiGii toxin family protein [Fusibacter tunisiensis]|uniref:Nucleotidyltransferase component of viral defense system n=1 Tax=Fusibacter tunisiensis TaxID=1008308 RepID=A0ABS2MNG9_9FIRM|nr:nucleotidyl transferase AbiEii/AbiGii toxin family protein [Fusibacter tunisiensis]MBM7560936.1 putative nucleotidyltransferase component of viral defense system [Fusibacter tunisiensis]
MEIELVGNFILGKKAFDRSAIEKRMRAGEFNSLSKFELYIWDLEMFLQLQSRLGDKIILKGGAATQFYLPISSQRTSIDIDMVCLASKDEVLEVIRDIEKTLVTVGENFKFRLYKPQNPRVGLDMLDTYFQTVPSICTDKELFTTRGKQEVKIEFMYLKGDYSINKMSKPKLFALETDQEFNLLSFENLFADKLTTLGPNTIGIHDDRSDEQVKQIYDVIELMTANISEVIEKKEAIKANYLKVAREECVIHSIEFDEKVLLADMELLINRLKNIENDSEFLSRANDFQSLYLRKSVNRNKTQWAIVGYQLELLKEFIFRDNNSLLNFFEISGYLEKAQFPHIQGPERGKAIKEVREKLKEEFNNIENLSVDIFKKKIDRIVWELVTVVDFRDIERVTENSINLVRG